MFQRIFPSVWAVMALAILFSGCSPLESKTSYQGQLTDASGKPVADGNYQMTFRLYGDNADPVGDALWLETQTVAVTDGLFNIALGASETITTALFAQKLWLGVEVEGDGEMTPRQELTGAPYAMSLVAGAGIQGTVDKDDPLPSSLNVANTGTGYGIGVNVLGEAGVAIDGESTGQRGLLIDDVLKGAEISATTKSGVVGYTSGTTSNDYYGVHGVSEYNDGVFGWGKGTSSTDTGVTGRGDNGYGVYGFSFGSPYGMYTPDDLYVGGSCTGCTLRYVSYNASSTILQIGDTVRATGVEVLEGMATPVMKVASAAGGDPVLGVVVGRTEMIVIEEGIADAKPGVHFDGVGGKAAPGDYLVIVVQGPAQVRAADANIKAGELVYQGVEGVDTQPTGTAIGMAAIGVALDSVDADGLVWVLVGFD